MRLLNFYIISYIENIKSQLILIQSWFKMSCLNNGKKKGSVKSSVAVANTGPKYERKKDYSLSPEHIVINKKYSTTWNPSDKRQYFDDVDRIDKLKKYTEQLLLDFPNVKLSLEMEVSKNGRLHWHGTIEFTSLPALKHFFVLQIHKLRELWNIDIDEITNDAGWTVYCTKQKAFLDEHVDTDSCLKKYRKVKVDKNGVAHKNYFTEMINDTINNL